MNENNHEAKRLELLGDLVKIVENILSPKPVHVWHVPGALQRVLASIIKIFEHGFKYNFDNLENNGSLWCFVFGLRVLIPNLWPTLDLKRHQTDQDKFVHWLTISLQNHNIRDQINILIEDEDRISSFYNDWAFLRCYKFTHAFFIVLNALENNSQGILAMIDPALMVSCYQQRKQSDSLHSTYIRKYSLKDESLKNSLLPTKTYREEDSNRVVKPDIDECDDGCLETYSVSPSCLEINYACNVLSDVERGSSPRISSLPSGINALNKNEPVQGEANNNPLKVKMRKKSNSKLTWLKNQKDSSQVTSSDSELIPKSVNFSDISSCASPSEKDPSLIYKNDINFVRPSSFLLNYVASKPKISERRNKVHLHFTNEEHKIRSDGSQSDEDYQTQMLNIKAKISEMKSDNVTVITKKRTNINKHFRSHSDGSKVLLQTPSSAFSLTEVPSSPKNIKVPPSFMDDGGHSIVPDADGFFPHPQPGQNLLEFLTSTNFSKSSAQLDRENAHFSVAEAVLAAIEQMNFDSKGSKKETRPRHKVPDESEDDVLQHKRNRRRTKLRSRSSVLKNSTTEDEPATTDYSMIDSPEASSDSEASFTASVTNEDSGGPTSCSTSDEMSSTINASDPSSAENIAIAILMHYNTKLLPQASELQWLVSEQDAPQKLLPMPNSVAVSPDDVEQSYFMPQLRGTSDWAPPRPQLILTLHRNTKRTPRLISQKWRCAGCGLKVLEKLCRHFRLCHYLGRYFCTNCHANKKATIPAHVLQKWDFKKYKVSNFAYELLFRMSSDPLFQVGSLNPRLYRMSRELHQSHIYRLQLFHARIYVNICARASKVKGLLDNVPSHWLSDPQIYSMEDLLAVKSGHFVNKIKHLTTSCINHISSCKVCLGQGFICEICNQGNPIFPFELDAVTQCTKCRECFHFVCFSPTNSCPRCARREKRDKEAMHN